MGLSLQELLPNLSGGLSNTGFMFGAGTSVEAGYPMMAQLTREVIQALHISDRAALDEVLLANAIAYDHNTGSPNVEVVADLVMAHALSTGASRFTQLESRLRDLVTEVILGVASPTLDTHVDFLTALRQRAFGRPSCIHIFTTNYDVLFELAGAEAGVVIETGFVGSVERFFDHQRFAMSCGVVQSQSRFSEHAALTVRLIKLHGSVSWITRGGNVFERHPASIAPADKRVMILPRRRKVMDTLQPPHDALFTVASRALGAECKYVAACGFSFSDDHINANLLGPAVSTGRIKLFALCEAETPGISALRSLPAFSAAFSTGGLRSGVPHPEATDCWKFSRFVKLFK